MMGVDRWQTRICNPAHPNLLFSFKFSSFSCACVAHVRILVNSLEFVKVIKWISPKLWESGRLIRMPSVRPSFPMDCFASRLRVLTPHPSIYQCDRAEIKISRFWSFASIAPIINGGGKGYTAKPKLYFSQDEI